MNKAQFAARIEKMHAAEANKKRLRTNAYNRAYYRARKEAERKAAREAQLKLWAQKRAEKEARRIAWQEKEAARLEAKRLKEEAAAAKRLEPKHKRTKYFLDGFKEGKNFVLQQLHDLQLCPSCTSKTQHIS